LATAKRLLGMGLTQEQVAKGTGLSIKEIEKLI
jgi:transcriptional regulator with XRE-family HTH domain